MKQKVDSYRLDERFWLLAAELDAFERAPFPFKPTLYDFEVIKKKLTKTKSKN